MAKTKEELNAIEEEIETVNSKLQELTEEELKQITGGKLSETELILLGKFELYNNVIGAKLVEAELKAAGLINTEK